MMKSFVLYLITESPLLPSDGDGGIQRDVISEFPIVWPETVAAGLAEFSGDLIGEARLVAMPVKTEVGPVWVSSPSLLSRHRRQYEQTRSGKVLPELPVAGSSTTQHGVLGPYRMATQIDVAAQEWLDVIVSGTAASYQFPLTVTDDETMRLLTKDCLDYRAVPEMKFEGEYLPVDTIMALLVTAENYEQANTMQRLDGASVRIGADQQWGHGLTRLALSGTKSVV